jgi:hypothetical protein
MSVPSNQQVTPERIMQFAWGYVPTLVLEAAIRHRVFDVLDAGPMNLGAIQAATGASLRGLEAITNALVGLNFLSKDAQGKLALTPESAAFLVSTKPSFQGGIIRHSSQQLIPKWLKLNEIVASGKPAAPVNQEDSGAQFFQKFVDDIFPSSYPAAQALSANCNYGPTGPDVKVLDLAAGSGVWGIALAQGSPRVHVTAVDWPEVIPVARKNAARFGLSERFTFIEGDLAQVPFGQDYQLATLGHILHSEGVDRGRRLLEKSGKSLCKGGTIAIAEFLVNADRTGPLNGLFFAVNMLVNTEHGGTYSFEEISEWLHDAGFADIRKLDSPGPSPLILATRS